MISERLRKKFGIERINYGKWTINTKFRRLYSILKLCKGVKQRKEIAI